MIDKNVLSVRQLNLYVRSLIESDTRLFGVSVSGEISNFKDHYSSGHWYFTLKDADAAIRCVMFRQNNLRVRFCPEDGQQVVLKGRVSLYEKDGQYQLYAEEMLASGFGDIALAFKQIKEKLEKEGMFDPATKRSVPEFPKKIAVITSPTGAAVRDIFNILNRRWPVSEARLFPVSVQGELAVPEMINALDDVYNSEEFDVIIIGRGGGSIEDLWAFNDEKLARKVFVSPIPVISAVGHETDWTIIDFVADLRAPTPSAAAELAVPDMLEMRSRISSVEQRIKNKMTSLVRNKKSSLEGALGSVYFKRPTEMLIERRRMSLDRNAEKLVTAISNKLTASGAKLNEYCVALDNLSPLKTLARGYAVAFKEGKNITDSAALAPKDRITLTFQKGSAECEVLSIDGDQ